MRKIQILCLIVVLLFVGVGVSASAQSNRSRDQRFIRNAAANNFAQITMARLAIRKAHNSSVRDYAKNVLAQQLGIQSQLHSLATQSGVTIPSGRPHNSAIGHMTGLSGNSADRYYTHWMVGQSNRMNNLFQSAFSSGTSSHIVDFCDSHMSSIQSNISGANGIISHMGWDMHHHGQGSVGATRTPSPSQGSVTGTPPVQTGGGSIGMHPGQGSGGMGNHDGQGGGQGSHMGDNRGSSGNGQGHMGMH